KVEPRASLTLSYEFKKKFLHISKLEKSSSRSGTGFLIGVLVVDVVARGGAVVLLEDVLLAVVVDEGWRYGEYTHRSMNTRALFVVKGIHVSDEGQRSLSKLKDTIRVIHQRKYPQQVNSSEDCFSIELSTNSSFAKLEKFEGVDFRRWEKKTHFMLSSMSVVCVLTTPMPEDGENLTVEQIRKRAKWDKDDYVCKGLIFNCMSDSLFDIYQNVDTSKEL
nr:zinc finger, CCHC-type [Tanacetum cinerariifolium]